MRVWLINIAEHSPVDGENDHLRRMGLLADRLTGQGHSVVWWTSTFDHSHKRRRFPEDRKVEVRRDYHLWFMHAPAYRRNVSLSRPSCTGACEATRSVEGRSCRGSLTTVESAQRR